MKTVFTGQRAETAAAAFLKKSGFKIIDRNWRTRWCEIDIIASRNNMLNFVEVKYRQTGRQGLGLDYITPNKLRQMRFAAEYWVLENEWDGDFQLAAVEVYGDDFTVTDFIETIV